MRRIQADRRCRALLLAGAALLTAGPAFAQDLAPAGAAGAVAPAQPGGKPEPKPASKPGPRPDTEASAQGQLETVVVTSQRRSQNIQDIPVSVSALSGKTLEQRQIVSTLDLARSVPNLVAANNVLLGTSVTYFMRGTGSTESIATFDLPVGTYIDDVFIARQNANQVALSDVERVEVLRGPQGTLFGRNTTGGAVSIITRKPNPTRSIEGEASYGSFNRRSFRGEVNAPISDRVMTRLGAFSVKDDGYLNNPPTNKKLNGETSWGVRGAARLLLTEGLTWDGSAQYIDTENTHVGVPGVVKSGPAGPYTVYPIPSTGDLLTGRYSAHQCEPKGPVLSWAGQGCLYDRVKSTLLISNFGFDTAIGKFNLISGYSDIKQSFVADNFANTDQPELGGIFGPNYYLANRGDDSQFSHELKLTGSAFRHRLDYVAGIYYLHERDKTDFVDSVGPLVLGDRTLGNTTESVAVYGQVDYHVTNWMALQLGDRLTDETKDFALVGKFGGAPITSADIQAAGVPLSQQVKRSTPRLAITFTLTPDIKLFGSYTKGFKSGGWNARSLSAKELAPFAPEFVTSFEAGIKSEFWGRRARLNATLFRADYSNLQVPAVFPGTADFVTLNAASARVQGLELETGLNAGWGLHLFTNIGLMDSEYTSLTAGAISAGLGPKLQRTPHVTAQVGGDESFEFGHGNRIDLSADGQYTDQFETDPENAIAGHVGPHTTYNAQLAWTPPQSPWTVSIGCRNCTDSVYVVQALLGSLYSNEPRRVEARVRFRY